MVPRRIDFDPGFRERGEPLADLPVGQHHRIAAGQQNLAELLAARLRVLPAVGGDDLVVGPHVVGDGFDLRQPLLGNGAVLALDLLLADQFLAIAEAAVGRAGGDDVEQAHLVLVQHSLDRSEVHLVAGVFGAGQVERLVRTGLDDPLYRLAVLGHLEVVPGHLHRHALLDVPFRSVDARQGGDLLRRVEALHVLRRLVLVEGLQADDDLTVVLGVLDRVQERLFALGRNVFVFGCHFTPRFFTVAIGLPLSGVAEVCLYCNTMDS